MLLYAADPKARRVGFVAGEDTLFVRMSLLTRAQLDQVVRGEEVLLHPEGLETPSTESDPPLDGLWGDGLDHDGVEIANILIEGEKAAKSGWGGFPTPAEMRSRVALIQEGLRLAGVTAKDIALAVIGPMPGILASLRLFVTLSWPLSSNVPMIVAWFNRTCLSDRRYNSWAVNFGSSIPDSGSIRRLSRIVCLCR